MVETIKELPKYIRPVQAYKIAGIAPSTFEYWRKTHPLLISKDEFGRSLINVQVFLNLCKNRYTAKVAGYGITSNCLRDPAEIERDLRDLKIPY